MSERSDNMTGKRLAARPADSGYCDSAAGWPTSSAEGVGRRQDVETGRFLFDDGRTLPRRPTPGKSQRYRRAEGWAASSQDVGSHVMQEDCAVSPLMLLNRRLPTSRRYGGDIMFGSIGVGYDPKGLGMLGNIEQNSSV